MMWCLLSYHSGIISVFFSNSLSNFGNSLITLFFFENLFEPNFFSKLLCRKYCRPVPVTRLAARFRFYRNRRFTGQTSGLLKTVAGLNDENVRLSVCKMS
jgi:hypothetical protein